MTPAHDPAATTDAARTIDEVADRATGRAAGDDPSDAPDGVGAAATRLTSVRDHLDVAGDHVDAGTEREVEPGPRGQVRRAALRGLRPVTDHQVAFNRELTGAVEGLTDVVEGLLPLLARVGLDDVVAGVVGRLDGLDEALAEQRRLLGATRAREEVVLRAAIRTVEADGAPDPPEATASTLARESRRSLRRRLAGAGRPDAEVLARWADEVAPPVVAGADRGPVLDLVPDRGDWLDAWRDLGLDARGVEPEGDRAALLAERGHRVEVSDPATLLHGLDPATVGAVTAATLADVVDLDELVEIVDGAAAALAPGGALVLAAAHPLSLTWSDPQWADPRRRPLHPATAEALALDRGFAEVRVVELTDADDRGPAVRAYALVARTATGSPPP